jgi:hypothetical protein
MGPIPEGFPESVFHPDDFPSGRFSIRLADAQTGRPYSNHFHYNWMRA